MATLRILTVADLHELSNAGEDFQVLDVRTPAEFSAGHIAGSVLLPHDQIAGWPEELDQDRRTAVICKAGVRALHAAAILDQLTGAELLVVVEGGVPDWPSLGGTLTTG
ncbi:MAG: rhodanese-like domain-containing protein [Patulibacter minatonensis]